MSTPPGNDLEAAVRLLRAGELVAFPTETVYGLGADAANPAAVARVFAAKGRPADHPLIVHLADQACVPDWASEFPETARQLARAFWPGPLTLVLPRSARVPMAVTGGQDSVALRVPAHPVAQALLRAFGGGVAAPSANRYGRVSPTRAEHVREELGDRVALILDGGECAVGLESTIVSCLAGQVALLRPGMIGRAAVESVVGPLATSAAGAPRVPGSTRAHYAGSSSSAARNWPRRVPRWRSSHVARRWDPPARRPGAWRRATPPAMVTICTRRSGRWTAVAHHAS